MRTNISLPKDDHCSICDEQCPENIYDCPKLNEAIATKKAYYGWCWFAKE